MIYVRLLSALSICDTWPAFLVMKSSYMLSHFGGIDRIWPAVTRRCGRFVAGFVGFDAIASAARLSSFRLWFALLCCLLSSISGRISCISRPFCDKCVLNLAVNVSRVAYCACEVWPGTMSSVAMAMAMATAVLLFLRLLLSKLGSQLLRHERLTMTLSVEAEVTPLCGACRGRLWLRNTGSLTLYLAINMPIISKKKIVKGQRF
jgi:hypothetical protein